MYFLLISALPLLICFIAFLIYCKKPYNFQFASLAGGLLLVIGITTGCVFAFGPEAESIDTEIWNGRITARYSEPVSCEHSYECNCYDSCSTDSDGHQSCTRICQTCYEHSYDVSWLANTSNRERIWFDRIDRQGLNMPPRYAKAFVGEPTAIEHNFTNYFKLVSREIGGDWSWDGLGWRFTDAYSKAILCSNCNYGFNPTVRLYIRKGVTVDTILGSVPCPQCECNALTKAAW